MIHTFLKCPFLLILCSTFGISLANQTLNITSRYWKAPTLLQQRDSDQDIRSTLSVILSFFAAMISSAGGLGGGGLFIPILTIVAGMDVKTASTYSAFMVTAGSVGNVGNYVASRSGAKRLIDYDVALLCQPSLLLGVSCGVVLNAVFPEWLIMILFVVFVAFCTFKTCKSGVLQWSLESRGLRGSCGEGGGGAKVPLLGATEDVDGGESETRWTAVGMLVGIWFSFFMLNLLRGNRYGQGIFQMEACGTGYWIISSLQIPLAVFFTSWILFRGKSPKSHAPSSQGNGGVSRSRPSLIFPAMALIAGLLGGVFGIGGGMLISPFLLQIGIDPQVTAATCSFMVLVSSSMSALQYLLLGMNHVGGALTYAAICFVASLVGLTVMRRAILRHGRPSMVVFSVATVMALSVVLMTSFGALDFWRIYKSGQTMGFNMPC